MKVFKTVLMVMLALLVVVLIITVAVLLFLRFFPSVGNVPDDRAQKLLGNNPSSMKQARSTMKMSSEQ